MTKGTTGDNALSTANAAAAIDEIQDTAPHRKGAPLFNPLDLETAANSDSWCWHLELAPDASDFLQDHQIHGQIVFPAAAYAELLLSAARLALGAEQVRLTGLTIRDVLVLKRGERTPLRVLLEKRRGRLHAQVCSGRDRLHAFAGIELISHQRTSRNLDIPTNGWSTARVQRLYQQLSVRGLTYGPAFRALRRIRFNAHADLAEIVLNPTLAGNGQRVTLHPVLLDACFHLIGARMIDYRFGGTYLPVRLGRLDRLAPVGRRIYCRATFKPSREQPPRCISAHLDVHDEAKHLAVHVESLQLLRLGHGALKRLMTG